MAPPQQCCPYQLLSRSSTVLNEQSSDSPRGRRRRQMNTQATSMESMSIFDEISGVQGSKLVCQFANSPVWYAGIFFKI